MNAVAKKKPKPEPTPEPAPQQPPKRSGEQLGVYIPSELMRALEDFIAAARLRTNKTAVTERALEDFLRAEGYWPRTKEEQP